MDSFYVDFIMPMSVCILTILMFYIAMWTIVKVKYKMSSDAVF